MLDDMSDGLLSIIERKVITNSIFTGSLG